MLKIQNYNYLYSSNYILSKFFPVVIVYCVPIYYSLIKKQHSLEDNQGCAAAARSTSRRLSALSWILHEETSQAKEGLENSPG